MIIIIYLSCQSNVWPMLISTYFVLSLHILHSVGIHSFSLVHQYILTYTDIHWFYIDTPYSDISWYPLILSCRSYSALCWYPLILSCKSIFWPMLISTDFVLAIHILTHCDIHLFYLVHLYSVLCWSPVILSVRSIFWHMLISTDFVLPIDTLTFVDIHWFMVECLRSLTFGHKPRITDTGSRPSTTPSDKVHKSLSMPLGYFRYQTITCITVRIFIPPPH